MGKLPASVVREISARFKAGKYKLELGVYEHVNKANLHTKPNGKRKPIFQQVFRVQAPSGAEYYLGLINNVYIKLVKSNGKLEPTDVTLKPEAVQNILNSPKFSISIVSW